MALYNSTQNVGLMRHAEKQRQSYAWLIPTKTHKEWAVKEITAWSEDRRDGYVASRASTFLFDIEKRESAVWLALTVGSSPNYQNYNVTTLRDHWPNFVDLVDSALPGYICWKYFQCWFTSSWNDSHIFDIIYKARMRGKMTDYHPAFKDPCGSWCLSIAAFFDSYALELAACQHCMSTTKYGVCVGAVQVTAARHAYDFLTVVVPAIAPNNCGDRNLGDILSLNHDQVLRAWCATISLTALLGIAKNTVEDVSTDFSTNILKPLEKRVRELLIDYIGKQANVSCCYMYVPPEYNSRVSVSRTANALVLAGITDRIRATTRLMNPSSIDNEVLSTDQPTNSIVFPNTMVTNCTLGTILDVLQLTGHCENSELSAFFFFDTAAGLSIHWTSRTLLDHTPPSSWYGITAAAVVKILIRCHGQTESSEMCFKHLKSMEPHAVIWYNSLGDGQHALKEQQRLNGKSSVWTSRRNITFVGTNMTCRALYMHREFPFLVGSDNRYNARIEHTGNIISDIKNSCIPTALCPIISDQKSTNVVSLHVIAGITPLNHVEPNTTIEMVLPRGCNYSRSLLVNTMIHDLARNCCGVSHDSLRSALQSVFYEGDRDRLVKIHLFTAGLHDWLRGLTRRFATPHSKYVPLQHESTMSLPTPGGNMPVPYPNRDNSTDCTKRIATIDDVMRAIYDDIYPDYITLGYKHLFPIAIRATALHIFEVTVFNSIRKAVSDVWTKDTHICTKVLRVATDSLSMRADGEMNFNKYTNTNEKLQRRMQVNTMHAFSLCCIDETLETELTPVERTEALILKDHLTTTVAARISSIQNLCPMDACFLPIVVGRVVL